MKLPIKQGLAAISLLLSTTAAAEDPTWFEVELLVFSYGEQATERWPDNNASINTNGNIDLFSPEWLPDVSHYQLAVHGCSSQEWLIDPEGCEQKEQDNSPHYPTLLPKLAVAEQLGDPHEGSAYLLPETMLQFGEQANKLQRSGNAILLHSGWQMPVYGKRAAKGFHIFGGKNYDQEFNRDGSLIVTDPNQEDPFAWLDGIAETDTEQPLWQLDGKLTIYLNRFLYIQPHLVLRKPDYRDVAAEQPLEDAEQPSGVQIYAIDQQPVFETKQKQERYLASIVMEQNRRVRSREIHYFDHPEFGVVIQIRRMEQPVREEEPAQQQQLQPTNAG